MNTISLYILQVPNGGSLVLAAERAVENENGSIGVGEIGSSPVRHVCVKEHDASAGHGRSGHFGRRHVALLASHFARVFF